ncbi:MAG: hypothetical protein QW555_02965 [Nitrososphaerota archaeon]
MASGLDDSFLLLTFLHNMGHVGEDRAVGVEEISTALQMDGVRVKEILSSLESDGYVARVEVSGRGVRFYLTGKGVIRVCSIYT